MGKKQFCFFQTAETGNRTPDSGVKGSGANHYPRAPARERGEEGGREREGERESTFISPNYMAGRPSLKLKITAVARATPLYSLSNGGGLSKMKLSFLLITQSVLKRFSGKNNYCFYRSKVRLFDI